MTDDHADKTALAQLRERLVNGRILAGLNMTELARRAGLGRTTVHAAFQADGPAPTGDTVAALARALGQPVQELLTLQRAATGEAPSAAQDADLGKPITDWDPHDLEVHPAGVATTPGSAASERVLSGYVPRAHDRNLADAVKETKAGRSRMVVLVGSSSTGKTRACWEALQPLAHQGWKLWHPFDPTRAEAALADLERVRPRTVIWLNEAQHYLDEPQLGERIAAALHALLTEPARGPVLILGTLWSEYANRYTAMPHPGGADPYSRVRELLAGRTVTVPDFFDEDELSEAATLAKNGDRLLADALTRVGIDGRLAQDLAGAPELLRRYQHGTPAVRALLEAAMDARRVGVGLHVPQAFLTDAAADYFTAHDWDHLANDWAEAAYADLARLVHGKQAPLRRTNPRPIRRPPGGPTPAAPATPPTGPTFRLADYLEQHGRIARRLLCPPASFWHAAHTHVTHADDLNNLAEAAEARCRLQWAHHLYLRAARAGHTGAMIKLGFVRQRAGERKGAEAFYQQAADAGNPEALRLLGMMRRGDGDREGAEALLRQAADAGETDALRCLAILREDMGDREGAEALFRQAADAGETNAFTDLVVIRERAGDREGAEAFAREAASVGDPFPLTNLSHMREEAGDTESAEALAREAFDAGDTTAVFELGRMREQHGDREGADAAFHQAADTNGGPTFAHLARLREEAGDQEGSAALALEAADAGDFFVLRDLQRMREQSEDREGVESLCRQAADAGHFPSLGHFPILGFPSEEGPWPYGLDPDGSPSPPWRADG
ncbi:helix-turn-helix domain-containing protein [Streptomyces sp. NPDC059071]|uniref:helix-turn-helix domain-containing protein n=1 Tax=unclassified Streptomyces TaxID=2593676 RepID=UPI003656CEDC